MRRRFAAVLILVGLAHSPGLALGSPEDEAAFAALDINEDGRLSGTEATTVKAFDANQDGRITKEEFLAGREKQNMADPAVEDEKLFLKQDISEDGWLSGKEAKGFEKFDTDENGEITKSEFLTGRAALRSQPTVSPEQQRAEAEKRFAQLDITEDGILSGTERRTVQEYDANGDGRITKAEFLAASVKPASPKSESNVDTFLDAVKQRSVKNIIEQMAPQLRQQVEEPVLQFMFNMADEQLGAFIDRPAQVETAEQKLEKGVLTTYSIAVDCERGQVTFRVAFQQGQLVLFSMESEGFKDTSRQLAKQLISNEAFAKKVADFYASRGAEILKLVMTGKDRDAYDSFHLAMRRQLPFEKVQEKFASSRENNGALKSLEFESIRTDVDENGNFQRSVLGYALDCEKGPARGEIVITFAGYQAAFVGFAIQKDTPVAPPMPSDDTPESETPWPTTKAEEHGLSFQMPGKPKLTAADGAVSYALDLAKDKGTLEVRIRSYDADMEAEAETFFNEVRDALKGAAKAKILAEEKEDLDDHPGKIFYFQLPNGSFTFLRIVLVGKRSYELQATWAEEPSDDNGELTERFIESAKLFEAVEKE